MSTQWEQDLAVGWCTGNEKDDKNVFVQCVDAYYYPAYHSVLDKPMRDCDATFIGVKLLLTICVPEEQRRQGIATRIIDLLEKKSPTTRLAIGPIMSEEMAQLVKKRRYLPVMPFSAIQPPLECE